MHRSLRPLPPSRNLTDEVAARIAAEILSGRLPPGARLPTEQEMVAATGVSRTVIREAVAALRAEGLVVTRQGAGAFVAADATRRPFRLAVAGAPSIDEVLAIMELRAGVETEAAGLAAARAGAPERQAIAAALAALDESIARGEWAIEADFAFHRAIAQATGNSQFAGFLEYLGRFIIPRRSVRGAAEAAGGRQAYLALIQEEHRAISGAISAGDVTGAREAMRRHLANSQDRYRRLAERAAAEAESAEEARPSQ
jgi:DNA-binding FadR family transcriptional regulator